MKKDSYYFPHFYNARSDRKILRARRELGIEGYAIYFMLLEILREQTDFSYPLSDVDLLADEFRTSEQKINAVISGYDLFQVADDKFFYSQQLIANLQPYLEKSERARLAARKRWDKSKKIDAKADANALPEQSKSNADQNVKRGEESKGEESKGYINVVLESFENWWNLYGKKGNRKKSVERWLKLTDPQREKCLNVVDNYIKSTPDKQFRKDGQSYLNMEAFEDEIVFSVTSNKAPTQQPLNNFGDEMPF